MAWDLSIKRWLLIPIREKKRVGSHGSPWNSPVAYVEEVSAPVVNFDIGLLFLGTIP